MKLKLLISALLTFSLSASNINDIKKLNWNNIEVVWLPDNRLPTYSLGVIFEDGALSDGQNPGITDATFDLLSAGTRRFSQKNIADNLEYFGLSYGASVNHEYVIYTVNGLVKDIIPSMKKICHLFNDATYPIREIQKAKTRYNTGIKTLVNNHGALASRIFREASLEGTPFSYPVGGKLKDKGKWRQANLKKHLSYFNNDVKKRIYITGPKKVLEIQKIIHDECLWKGKGHYSRSINYTQKVKNKGPRLIFVKVPKANQAQVRIGRLLEKGEHRDDELMLLMTRFLGGGFTSVLMRELRVKRGLTYGVSAVAQGQKDYGRAVVNTFTKEETVGEMLAIIRDQFTEIGAGAIDINDLNRAKGALAGGHLFQFEQSSALLGQLVFLDHIDRDYQSLWDLPSKIKSFTADQVASQTKRIFDWNKMTIVVLGSNKALEQMKKFGKVEIKKYNSFL